MTVHGLAHEGESSNSGSGATCRHICDGAAGARARSSSNLLTCFFFNERSMFPLVRKITELLNAIDKLLYTTGEDQNR